MAIPAEFKAQLDRLRQERQDIRDLSNEQLKLRLQQTVQSHMSHLGGPDVADMELISTVECVEIGYQLLNVGRLELAERWLLVTLEKAEKAGDLMGQSEAANFLGRLCSIRGEFPQAMKLLAQALRVADQIGSWGDQDAIYDHIGTAYTMQGQYPQAIDAYKWSLEIYEELGNIQGLAICWGNLGNAYRTQGKFVHATEALYEMVGDSVTAQKAEQELHKV